MSKNKVGLGICSYNRPDYLVHCITGVEQNLLDVADIIWIYNDGSDKKHKQAYQSIYNSLPQKIKYRHAIKNKGVAHAKNWLLKKLIDEECDYLFILEEDIVVDSPKAITEYIRLSKVSGIEHMMFAHHGKANEGMLYKRVNGIDLYTAAVGAWCMYTRNAIEVCGYFDENMLNAMEHIEHTFRIQMAGLCTPYPLYPDVTKSKEYMHEIPGSIDNSSIRPRKDWQINIYKALVYWREKDKHFPLQKMIDKIEAQADV